MTASHLLPDGTIPVLISTDVPDLLVREAAALLGYTVEHPEVTPQSIARMLFGTRSARRHRALAMVTGREELIAALRSVVDGTEHPALVRSTAPATPGGTVCVFPGQGGQRPGMGRLYYDAVPAFRAEADRCAAVFATQTGTSPLDYLLGASPAPESPAAVVQPALFTFMAALAAMWRSFGVAPSLTVGHSQGEIAAGYVAGLISLADAVRVVSIRARAADRFTPGRYAMAVVAADRDTCEAVLARCSGFAELSVINSPGLSGISGDRATVEALVATLTERGVFAKVIGVDYPAHTSAINDLADEVRTALRRELDGTAFCDAEIGCIGATLGGPITAEFPVADYWFWNLRNTVRFDQAVASALALGGHTFVELAGHPTLQLALGENCAPLTVGTATRAATDLGEFTANLARVAVNTLDYPWECLRTGPDGGVAPPLPDFPNTVMNNVALWLPYGDTGPAPQPHHSPVGTPRLLTEEWIRLSQRSMSPPRSMRIIDPTGDCAELAAALRAASTDLTPDTETTDAATQVVLLPPRPGLDPDAAVTEVAAMFATRWLEPVRECWLVTVGGEVVVPGDPAPDLVHAGASAGFRGIGAEHPGVRFGHLDLPAGSPNQLAPLIVSALHTADEPDLALRDGRLYAKRIIDSSRPSAHAGTAPPGHVLIIGGTGNLGLEFAEHFAGAARITLVSRSGETPARLEALAARITAVRCDVTDPAAVARLADQFRDAPADLIIHAAMTHADMELADITVERAEQVLRAKVAGGWRVLQAFPRSAACRVVLCSSVAATIGGRGQIGYAAANRMLDALGHWLRSEGLDCVSVQWGQWTTLDLDAAGWAKLAATGMLPMAPADAIALGMAGLSGNAIVAAFDLDRARPVLAAYGYGPLLSVLESPTPQDPTPLAPSPAGPADPAQRLLQLLAGAIGVGPEAIDTTIPMVAIGLDSLQALEFHRRVKTELNHDLNVADLLGGATVADVLADVLTKAGGLGSA